MIEFALAWGYSMVNRFELFRLSLLERDQKDLYAENFKDFSREQWLKHVFLEQQPFDHYGSEFHYVSSSDDSTKDIIVGRVGRHIVREENLPPDEGLVDVTRDAWLASVVVLDPTHHEDGQKLAIQSITSVGKPSALLKELVSAINLRYRHGPYKIEFSQIAEEQSFWEFVETNRGLVTSVSFDFIAPNMFGGDDAIDKDMREFRDKEKARKVTVKLQNEDGIDPETERVRSAVRYASRGGGRVSARARGKPSYNSADSVKRTRIDDVKETGAELVKVAKDLANRILGRE